MAVVLNIGQQRVLGVLIEKSLAHPDYYPLTLNAITAGCNQKQNREPVMSLSEGEIGRVIHELQEMDLVSQASASAGARANRFAHEVRVRFGWDRPHQAIMAELLVRGPQTGGELRSRAGRMAPLESLESVSQVLNDLATRETPFVVELEREPGKSATRFAHLLCPEDQVPEPGSSVGTAEVSPVDVKWSARVEELEEKLNRLVEKVARIEAKVNTRLP